VSLSPALIFGWGPFPRLGVTGAALAVVSYYVAGALVLFAYLASGRSLVRLAPTLRFERELFAQILRVGAPSLVNNVMTNLTVVLLTALVGPFGTFALAGYGMGVRLEYLLIPLVFGFGSALVTMVGTNFGAGQAARARRVAWTGALIAAGATAVAGATKPEAARLHRLAPGAPPVAALRSPLQWLLDSRRSTGEAREARRRHADARSEIHSRLCAKGRGARLRLSLVFRD